LAATSKWQSLLLNTFSNFLKLECPLSSLASLRKSQKGRGRKKLEEKIKSVPAFA
jgi:hypothetical protein